MTSGGPEGAKAFAQRLRTPEQLAVVYAAVVHSALDAVIVVDEQGIVVTINQAAEDTFGYPPSEAIGKNIVDLIVPDHLKAAHEAGMARYRTTREPHAVGRRVEMEGRCADGRIIPVELAITEVKLPEGILFTANLRDLSSAREAAAEIERQHEALSQSEKMAAIGSLLAGVAHELNNPLSIVLGQSTLLRDELGDAAPPLLDRIGKIEAAGERCARIVRSFLAIARQKKVEKRAFHPVPLVEQAIELLDYGFRSAGVEIVRTFAADLPEAVADPDQVQNIITNLLVNALQALETIPGPREIRIGVTAGNESVGILIADNGPGISPEHARRIFEPFFTTKPQGFGTGIGLSISRGLAEAQGGQLAMVDIPDCRGAAFELTLPTVRSLPVEGEPGAEVELPVRPPYAQDLRAIVIDDEPEIASLLSDILCRLGYRCETGTSGREGQALIAARPETVDLILCDLRMPDVDGPTLFRWLQANHPALAGRVLFVTGDALGPAAGRFLGDAGRPVLEKPFTSADVADLLRKFPGAHREGRPGKA